MLPQPFDLAKLLSMKKEIPNFSWPEMIPEETIRDQGYNDAIDDLIKLFYPHTDA